MRGRFKPSDKPEYQYEVIQVDRIDGRTIGESERYNITENDLQRADRIFYRLKGGDMDADEVTYKWVGGPFPSQRGLAEAIEDIEVYGSPEPLPDFSKFR